MTRHPRFSARRARAGGFAAALAATAGSLALMAAPAGATTARTSAASDMITSQNWSGYAAHGSSAKFDNVSARWRLPAASCTSGEQSFSSFWVGIGGYDENSTGLEQDGTELDCNASGTQTLSAWYELLPAAPHTVKMTVKSGDVISASVHLSGRQVTLRIADLTRRESFSKTVTDNDIDNTSAEWIAEAPSECNTSATDCTVLPLADFGAVRFSHASATTTAGVTSGIKTSRWTTTELVLGSGGGTTSYADSASTSSATPTALTESSSQFEVAWTGTTASAGSGTTTTTTTTTTTPTTTGSGGGSGTPPNPGGGGWGSGGPGGGGAGGF